MKRTLLTLHLAAALAAVTACSSTKELTCAADQHVCSNACVSLQSDAKNCGTCGNVCGAGQGCSAGACVDCTTNPAACTAAVVAACFNLNQVRSLGADLSPAGPPIATDSGPSAFAQLGTTLYVANDLSSSISAITLVPPSATTGASAIKVTSPYSDLPFVASHRGLLWASNSAANTFVVADPASGAVVSEIPLPAGGPYGANPQGIAFVGEKAYVALPGADALGVIDVSQVPGTMPTPRTIDLSGLAAPGAKPLPAHVVATSTRVYVTLNDLDTNYALVAGGNGRLAVIDPVADAVIGGAVDLGPGCLDPNGMVLSGTTLWIGCGFHEYNSTAVTGGAVLPVDLTKEPPAVGQPIALPDHAAGTVAICGGRGYAGATESGTVIAFDPTSRTVLSTALSCPPEPGKGSYVADLACAP